MATDLHERIKFAIEVKLMLAENATPGPWEYAVVEGRGYIGRADTLPSVAEVEFDADLHFMLAFAPDHAIRACRADLERLHRHRPYWFTLGGCHCTTCGFLADPELAWPCVEITALATVYGIEATE